MSSCSFAAPIAALEHPVWHEMMKKLMTAGEAYKGNAAVESSGTYTSVLAQAKRNDDCHRYWFVANQVAETHLGVNLLEFLKLCDEASATPRQTEAARDIHECYIEGQEHVMKSFYDLGITRVSTDTHRYALDFALWMRGTFLQPPAQLTCFPVPTDGHLQ